MTYKEKDIHYKVWTVRLHEDTVEELKKRREEKKLSWNLFIKDLLYGQMGRK